MKPHETGYLMAARDRRVRDRPVTAETPPTASRAFGAVAERFDLAHHAPDTRGDRAVKRLQRDETDPADSLEQGTTASVADERDSEV